MRCSCFFIIGNCLDVMQFALFIFRFLFRLRSILYWIVTNNHYTSKYSYENHRSISMRERENGPLSFCSVKLDYSHRETSEFPLFEKHHYRDIYLGHVHWLWQRREDQKQYQIAICLFETFSSSSPLDRYSSERKEMEMSIKKQGFFQYIWRISWKTKSERKRILECFFAQRRRKKSKLIFDRPNDEFTQIIRREREKENAHCEEGKAISLSRARWK